MKPTMIADPRCECAEGPIWHTGEQALYWVDIAPGRLYSYSPASEEYKSVHKDSGRIGGITVQPDGTLLLFSDEGAVKRWNGQQAETIIDRIPGEENTRFNDVIADPEGRVFAGMMGTDNRKGRLYRILPDGSYTVVRDGIGTPNGLGFSPDNTQLYFTDSEENRIYRYDYDLLSGSLSNEDVFVEVPEEDGTPDGLTVDTEGYVWSARWNGKSVARYSPDGTVVNRIEFPAQRVTSVMFGGESFETLYVTTAGGDNRDEEGPGAGAIFAVDVDISGTEAYRSRLTV